MTNPLTAIQGYRTMIVALVALVAGALQLVGLGMSQSTQGGLVLIILAVLAAYFRLKATHIFVGGINIQKVAVAVDGILDTPAPAAPATSSTASPVTVTATSQPLTAIKVVPAGEMSTLPGITGDPL